MRYDDGDEEDLTRQQLEKCHAKYAADRKLQFQVTKEIAPVLTTSSCCMSNSEDIGSYNKALTDLCNRVGFNPNKIGVVLAEMEQPYCLNTAVERIMEEKGRCLQVQAF